MDVMTLSTCNFAFHRDDWIVDSLLPHDDAAMGGLKGNLFYIVDAVTDNNWDDFPILYIEPQ